MSDFDYETLLNRARDNIPEDISSRARWRLPEPQIMIEGSNTILRNFTEVVGMMDRDDNHVYQYILNELGTSGSRDGPRARFKGRIPPKRLKKAIVGYVNTYIKCSQCGAPDTHLPSALRIDDTCDSILTEIKASRFLDSYILKPLFSCCEFDR